MNNLHICIIAEDYPTDEHPLFPFVQQLAYSLSNEGVKCSVIAPQSLTKALFRHQRVYPLKQIDSSPEGKEILVIRPYIITFSNIKSTILQKTANVILRYAMRFGVKLIGNVDCLYSYFWHIGLTTASAFKNCTIPIFVQASECGLTIHSFLNTEENKKRISGVICASRKNLDESLDAKLVIMENTSIVPNGYRRDEFYFNDKFDARKKMGYPQDVFIVAFVGGFIERKGIDKLSEALSRFDSIYSIFIGQGDLQPTCDNILFKGKVAHNEIVNYLNCADIFVLPTNAEGCCNAIIEALACGLPVVSSKKSFNDEILDESCSIRINELESEEIYDAIKQLYTNQIMRKQMSQAALIKAQTLTIEYRAKAIRDFITKNLLVK